MNENRIKVLYIAGMSRSGSTILGNILGEIDGFFNAGELIDIWDRGLASDGKCGCGMKISKCEVWRTVLDKAFGNH
ncbi:MAG TPA: sulfotransferase, partial [Nitrospirae bacterium]|nr:sulfotransferase [Nitrospirota bacterium]